MGTKNIAVICIYIFFRISLHFIINYPKKIPKIYISTTDDLNINGEIINTVSSFFSMTPLHLPTKILPKTL
jgi:hypothetical protein